jgi:predicted dehydrogenase
VLRIGVIGAGRIAQIAHVATLSTVADAQIVALADLRFDLATLVAQRWNIPAVYPSHAELLADGRVDAVVVVTSRWQTSGAPVMRSGT